MKGIRRWLSLGIALVTLSGGLFTTTACANRVVSYCHKNNLPTELVDLLKPLGSDGIDANEKILVDELALLPLQVQTDVKTLYLLSCIVNDGKVTEDEISSFGDFDSDGLKNSEEVITHRTNLWLTDSDQDGLKDGDEVLTFKTDPLKADSDNDGFDDIVEVLTLKTDPLNSRFDYNVDTIITDYAQIRPIVEKVVKDLNVAHTLNKVSFELISNSEFRALWTKSKSLKPFPKPWESDPTWGAVIFQCSSNQGFCQFFARQEEAYKVLENVFGALGIANHCLLYPEHYRSSDYLLKQCIANAFRAAAIRRLEEMGCTGWQVGETSEGVGEFSTRVVKVFKIAVPSEFFSEYAAPLNWLAVTDDENLGLMNELRKQKKLSSQSCLRLYTYLLHQDNNYLYELREKMLKRTTWDSYMDEVFNIVESRFVLTKAPEKRDIDIVKWEYFGHP